MKRKILFNEILSIACDECEQSIDDVLGESRKAELVDVRLMAVNQMLKFGLTDDFISSMFNRTRQWVCMCKHSFDDRYNNSWQFKVTYKQLARRLQESCNAIESNS
jgi:hypothetical protein